MQCACQGALQCMAELNWRPAARSSSPRTSRSSVPCTAQRCACSWLDEPIAPAHPLRWAWQRVTGWAAAAQLCASAKASGPQRRRRCTPCKGMPASGVMVGAVKLAPAHCAALGADATAKRKRKGRSLPDMREGGDTAELLGERPFHGARYLQVPAVCGVCGPPSPLQHMMPHPHALASVPTRLRGHRQRAFNEAQGRCYKRGGLTPMSPRCHQ